MYGEGKGNKSRVQVGQYIKEGTNERYFVYDKILMFLFLATTKEAHLRTNPCF